jgi:hypothetical protein
MLSAIVDSDVTDCVEGVRAAGQSAAYDVPARRCSSKVQPTTAIYIGQDDC